MIACPSTCSGLAYSGLKREDAGGGLGLILVRIDQLGDAEVEQLGRAFRGHQDVAGLEIAVDHQVAVGVGDRVGDRQEKLQLAAQRPAAGRGRR